MKKQLMMVGMATALLLAACGNEETSTDEVESEESTVEEGTSSNGEEITDEQQASLDEQFNGMSQDKFIDSIEPQTGDYSEITIVMSEEAIELDEAALEGKMRGTGESIRNSTAGILHDGADGTLPLVEFENPEGEVIAYYDSHERDADMHME